MSSSESFSTEQHTLGRDFVIPEDMGEFIALESEERRIAFNNLQEQISRLESLYAPNKQWSVHVLPRSQGDLKVFISQENHEELGRGTRIMINDETDETDNIDDIAKVKIQDYLVFNNWERISLFEDSAAIFWEKGEIQIRFQNKQGPILIRNNGEWQAKIVNPYPHSILVGLEPEVANLESDLNRIEHRVKAQNLTNILKKLNHITLEEIE